MQLRIEDILDTLCTCKYCMEEWDAESVYEAAYEREQYLKQVENWELENQMEKDMERKEVMKESFTKAKDSLRGAANITASLLLLHSDKLTSEEKKAILKASTDTIKAMRLVQQLMNEYEDFGEFIEQGAMANAMQNLVEEDKK